MAATARRLPPYQQGQFDGLCAVYLTVNALRLLLADQRPLTAGECERLYRCGVDVIEAQGRLRIAACWGVNVRLWHRVIADLCAQAGATTRMTILIVRPLRHYAAASRTTIFAAIERAIDAGWPVLVLLRGAYRHYSGIRGYTASRLLLHDSYGYAWLEKGSCGAGRSRRRHQLPAAAITVLELG